MKIKNLHFQNSLTKTPKLQNLIDQLQDLLSELRSMDLPEEIIGYINTQIEEINSSDQSIKKFGKLLKNKTSSIVKIIESKLKIVPKNYYQTFYMAIGMAAFGIPLGVAFGLAMGNMAFLGIGIPIGLALGIGIGTAMDQKALKEGRQLKTTIKY